jgi:hypothetical protein
MYPSGAVISTRMLLDIARRINVCGTKPRDAVVATFNAQFDPGDEPALSVLIDSQYPIFVEVEDESEIEITEEQIDEALGDVIISDKVLANRLKESVDVLGAVPEGHWRCVADRQQYGNTVRCDTNNAKQLTECYRCSAPNPAVTAAKAKAEAERKANPTIITVAKHYFVNRSLNGQLVAECQFRFDPAQTDKVCGKPRINPIHH